MLFLINRSEMFFFFLAVAFIFNVLRISAVTSIPRKTHLTAHRRMRRTSLTIEEEEDSSNAASLNAWLFFYQRWAYPPHPRLSPPIHGPSSILATRKRTKKVPEMNEISKEDD
ncbi:hypothetical protein DMENIID0001_027070 [Sergentomyia squamirostris]